MKGKMYERSDVIMVQTHQHSCVEGTTMPLPPQEAEKIWQRPSDPQKVKQRHN